MSRRRKFHVAKAFALAKTVGRPWREARFIYDSLSKDLLQKRGKSKQALDLGCCSIEVPAPVDEP